MANGRARSLRKRPTIAELRLWDQLKLLKHEGFHFRRQAPIGKLVVDFVCYSQRLIVEVDGVQHDRPREQVADAKRDSHLRWRGFSVVRFRNGDVMDKLDGVMREVWSLLDPLNTPFPPLEDLAQVLPPPLSPPHKGEGDARASRTKSGTRPAHITPVWPGSSQPSSGKQQP